MRRVAVQMDPIETMVVNRDTSLAFMLEAQARGFEVWWFHPSDLWWTQGALHARAHRVSVRDQPGDHYTSLESRDVALDAFDVVLIRQDPPFDMGYVSNTYLLERAGPKPFVVNGPAGVRSIPEKLATLAFPELIPPTFVGRNLAALRAFAAQFAQVVLKPAFFAGGEGVLKTSAASPDFDSAVGAMLAEIGSEPLIAQEYLPRVTLGDKRVFILDGKPAGAVARLPKQGEFRVNLHVGGTPAPAELDDRDREICAAVAPMLDKHDIVFAGLDVIDGRLIEINVTSPTLIRQLVQFGGPDLAVAFWDVLERRLR